VLQALAGGEAMTAGDVAKTTRLARETVSTTLSKLSADGAVLKADRGYRLPASAPATGVDRALDGLRSKLAAGLRHGRA
jgi:DNA-binding IclR family transcriptional regulator